MAKVRLQYDGWLVLPAAIRRQLGVTSGDQLDLELAGGCIVLRPVRPYAAAEPVSVAAPAPPPAAEPPPAAHAPVKRGSRRPRKLPAAALPPGLKARGGRRKASGAAETAR